MRTLLLVLLVLTVSACKVRITVPTGGDVTTQSGAYFCAAGDTCEIEVNDLFFNEQFVASAADGYEFVEWKTQADGLCGGFTGSCTLVTFFFDEYPELMEILESDRVYYLEPVFAPVDAEAKSAAACFNPARWSKGARLIARYRGPQGGVVKMDETVGGSKEFNGYRATEIVTDSESDNPPATWQNLQYISIDKGRRRLNTRGVITDSFTPEVSTHTMTNQPGDLFRFDLAKGVSYPADHVVETLMAIDGLPGVPELPPGVELPPGFEVPNPADGFLDRTNWQRKVTYVGRQDVTVPAGTFPTCRFKMENVVKFSSGLVERFVEITWIGVDNGVMIKHSNDGEITVLLSGKLNGQNQLPARLLNRPARTIKLPVFHIGKFNHAGLNQERHYCIIRATFLDQTE